MKVVLVVVLLASVFTDGRVIRIKRSWRDVYRMCVPKELINQCNEMADQETGTTAQIVCVPAADRVECLDKIYRRQADFGVVDPEDMYLAANVPDENFIVFEEIRTLEEPDAEYRYEGVVVVHKDLDIKDIRDIRGLRSCHTGVGRNVGYKIPITKLKNMGIIGHLNEPGLSPRENELKAFSNLFSKACIVGKWSPDPKIDTKLKQRYSNLCELCEHPDICDYPDKFSGYDGALRCLAHNGGQIAWTKVIYVRKFFGLPVGTTPGHPSPESPDDYRYLCPNGTKVPINNGTTLCRWAARPWQGYMTNFDMIRVTDALRRKLENLNTIGKQNHSNWLKKVLEINEKQLARETVPISPQFYLDKANYTDVIERNYGPPYKYVRFCVTSKEELAKCKTLSQAAFSRDIRPTIDCVEESDTESCLKAIRDNKADIITVHSVYAEKGKREYNLQPILSEIYEDRLETHTVAVVKRKSSYQSFEDLRGAKSCHSAMGSMGGYLAPLYQLIKQKLIKKDSCPYPVAVSEFFSGGICAPGSKTLANVPSQVIEKLCSICAGNIDADNPSTKCNGDASESYFGYDGALRCLAQGDGDVAFLIEDTVYANVGGRNSAPWAAELQLEDFELLCPNGGRAPINEFKSCYLARVPTRVVLTSYSKSRGEVDEIKNALLTISNLYTTRPDLFKLFGPFRGKSNLLFLDQTKALLPQNYASEAQKEISELIQTVYTCENSPIL